MSNIVFNLPPFGVPFDEQLSMADHVTAVCKSCFVQLRQLSLIRSCLTMDSAKTLVHAFISSRLDHCNRRGGGGGNAAPKYQKFPLFGKESPRRGEPLDRFLKFLGTFIRPTIKHQLLKFHVIRFTDYGVIAEKPRVGHLDQIFPCTL